jgi:bacterial/archaeal transporter family-2 protein
MDRSTAVLLTAFGGGVVALQAPINGHLASVVGNFQATLISFVIGTIALLGVVALAKGGYEQMGEVRHVGWVYLTGGLLGAIYVTAALTSVRTLGAGGVTAATFAGQLTLSLVVDQLGILGVAKQPITAGKLLGVALLSAGVYFIVRD